MYPVPEPPDREDVEALARWPTDTNQADVLSLYADLTDPRYRNALEERRSTVAGVLAPERVDAFEAAFEAATRELADVRGAGVQGAAVFVSPEQDRARGFGLAVPVTTRLVWDTSPYVRPLARFVDDYEDLAVVLVDGSRAQIHHVAGARPEHVLSRSVDLQGRHKKGGWSQMRYQRARQTAMDRFLDDVVDQLDRLVREHGIQQVIVAGQGTVHNRLAKRLPPRLLERLTAVEAVDLDEVHQPELMDRLTELARAREAEASREAVEAVLSRVERGELATADPFAVARAARDGRVELLVVDESARPGGAKCEVHDTVFERGGACPCGDAGTPVDLANEAVEDASRSDARVEFAESKRLRAAGGLAALLRW